jgi:hypothetical protein
MFKIAISISTVLFISFELALYLFMILADFIMPVGFIGIATCLFYTIILCICKKGIYSVGVAFVFVIFADYYVMFFGGWEISSIFFSCAQLVYFVETLVLSFSVIEVIINIVIRVVLIGGFEGVVYAIFKKDFQIVEGIMAFYYINIIVNVIFALIHFRRNFFFPLGLFLFLLCDTYICLTKLNDQLHFTGQFIQAILNVEVNVAWVFYLPGQVLLALSILFATPWFPTKKCIEKYSKRNEKNENLQINLE